MVRASIGPIGGGKSVACYIELTVKAHRDHEADARANGNLAWSLPAAGLAAAGCIAL